MSALISKRQQLAAASPPSPSEVVNENESDYQKEPHPYDLTLVFTTDPPPAAAQPTNTALPLLKPNHEGKSPFIPRPGIIRDKKTCRHCKLLKFFSDYATDTDKKDGLKATCKDCYNAERNSRKAAHRASTIQAVQDKLAEERVVGVVTRIDNMTVAFRDYGLAKDFDKKRSSGGNKNSTAHQHPANLDLIGPPPLKTTPLPYEVAMADPPIGPITGEQKPLPNGYFSVPDMVRNGEGKLRGKFKQAICDNPACRRNHTQVRFTHIYPDRLPNGTSCLVLLCVDCYSQFQKVS